jgi:hypothetical protein
MASMNNDRNFCHFATLSNKIIIIYYNNNLLYYYN